MNYAPDPPPQSEIESRRAGGYLALDALERHLALEPFIVGRRYSIADIALYGYTHVAEEGGFDLSRYAAIHRWLDRVARAPGHVPITARAHGPLQGTPAAAAPSLTSRRR